jgi:DNA-binding GntR family transcriptional regulator
LRVSRTPVREALYRLRDEGYIDVTSKSGWTVRPFEFETFEQLYEVRAVLELAAVKRLCEMVPAPPLEELKEVWLVPHGERLADGREVGRLDEAFHHALVVAAGNPELARARRDRRPDRLVRRLEFTVPDRIAKTSRRARADPACHRAPQARPVADAAPHAHRARPRRGAQDHVAQVRDGQEGAPAPNGRLARGRDG